MFGRKNQNILSEHYTKLVDHGSDSDDDFITLKRADHALPDDPSLPSASALAPDPSDVAGVFDEGENLSKRKQRMAKSKKAMLKFKGAPTRLVFDDEGQGHEVYEMKDVDEVFKGDKAALQEARKFAREERERLREVDVADKAEAKEKKREKKRKRKDREREVRYISPLLHYTASSDGGRRKRKGLLGQLRVTPLAVTMDTSRRYSIYLTRRTRRQTIALPSICRRRSEGRAMTGRIRCLLRRRASMMRTISRLWRCKSCGEDSPIVTLCYLYLAQVLHARAYIADLIALYRESMERIQIDTDYSGEEVPILRCSCSSELWLRIGASGKRGSAVKRDVYSSDVRSCRAREEQRWGVESVHRSSICLKHLPSPAISRGSPIRSAECCVTSGRQ